MARRRRGPLRRLGLLLSTPVGAILLIGAITGGAGSCLTVGGVGGTADTPSTTALAQIPHQLLHIFEQVAAQYHIPWEVLAAIANNECSLANSSDPSCTLQPGATGPGAANHAGASGLMQIGVGGAAGDEYQSLRHYLPNPALGPHDPTTAIQLAALVLTNDKGAPPGRPIRAYLPYVTAYNGSGPSASAYGQRVIADAQNYQGTGTTAVSSSSLSSSLAGAQCAAAATQFVAGNGLDPIPGFRPGRDDMGVDACANPAMPIIAPAQSTLVEVVHNWYAGQPLMLLKFNPPLAGTLDGDQYWYVAEQITPVTERPGTVFQARQVVARFASSGTCIEIGWGSPTSNARTLADVTDPGSAHPPAGAQTRWGETFKQFFRIPWVGQSP
jgi:hypothetical protein